MASISNEELLNKLKTLASSNFPKFQKQLPLEEQVYVLKTNEGLSVVIRFSRDSISIQEGEYTNPISTLTTSSFELNQMLTGQLDPVKAFLGGKIKIQGDVFKTMALNNLLKGG